MRLIKGIPEAELVFVLKNTGTLDSRMLVVERTSAVRSIGPETLLNRAVSLLTRSRFR